MISAKKLEIITSSTAEDKVIQLLKRHQILNYTLLRHVEGNGKRGRRSEDDFIEALQNCYFVIICAEQQALMAVEALGPLLANYGGVCALTDCQTLGRVVN